MNNDDIINTFMSSIIMAIRQRNHHIAVKTYNDMKVFIGNDQLKIKLYHKLFYTMAIDILSNTNNPNYNIMYNIIVSIFMKGEVSNFKEKFIDKALKMTQNVDDPNYDNILDIIIIILHRTFVTNEHIGDE